MPQARFTQRWLQNPPHVRYRLEFFDPRYPGLRLRTSGTSGRSWSYVYRRRGRLCRLHLGNANLVGLADAVKLAKRHALELVQGLDPRCAQSGAADSHTVTHLVAEYSAVAARKRGWKEERRILHREILPVLGSLPISELGREHIHLMLKPKLSTAPVMANRILARLCRLLSFGVEIGWLDANPALRLPKPHKETSRDRILIGEELRSVYTRLCTIAASSDPLGDRQAARAMLLMLHTGQRPGEVARLKKEDIHHEDRTWWISDQVSKNGRGHTVPLSESALWIVGEASAESPGEYVFGTLRSGSIRERFKKAALRFQRRYGLPGFRAHDLRRTAATLLAGNGTPREHIAHLLNHRSVTRAGVTAIYDRYDYRTEKERAVATLDRLLSPFRQADTARGQKGTDSKGLLGDTANQDLTGSLPALTCSLHQNPCGE